MTIRRYVLWVVCVFFLYLIAAKLGLKYAVIGQTVTLLWPPSGVALTATLIGGYRLWPGIALGAFIANAETGVPLVTLVIITLGNTLEPLCGTLLLRRQNSFSVGLDKVSDVFALVLLAAFISTTLGASLGTLGLFVGGKIIVTDLWPTWIAWWLGDGMGVLVISPVLLIGSSLAHSLPLKLTLEKTLELLVIIVALTAIGQIIFGDVLLAGPNHFQVSLSMFPFAIWSALRFGSIGAASITMIAYLLAIKGTAQGTGPFALLNEMDSLILWCLFADIMAVTGLLLAAINSGREKALLALKDSNENLEMQVQKRTDELSRINQELNAAIAEQRRIQMEMDQISEERLKMIGQELHDSLGQQLTGITFLVSSLHAVLGAKSAPETPIAGQIKDLLTKAMSVVRSLSHGLYPVILENSNFSSALQQLAETAQCTSGIKCTVQYTAVANQIDRNIALNLYRIAQEAVSNSLRHSRAKRIIIHLSESGDQYLLSVEDNGRGFVEQNINQGLTLGIRSMRCRADLIRAVVKVYKNTSGGMTVCVTGSIKREG